MKLVATLLFCASALAPLPGLSSAAAEPRGTVLELHSCELYAGGCIVSSEATQAGRYMLRAWNVTGGQFGGTALGGLTVALLQDSTENLASQTATPQRSVVYLPDAATPAQRAALLGWLRSTQRGVDKATTARVVAITWNASQADFRFAAGDYLSVKTASLESCATGGCGEALWYTPRTDNTVFTVAVNQASRVAEPLLQLKWEDAGKKSVFLARFGQPTASRNIYVSLAELCGPAGALF